MVAAVAGTPTEALRNNDISAGDTITVNKPTGVANGDLLIAAVSCRRADGFNLALDTWVPPSGWTEVAGVGTAGLGVAMHARMYYLKVPNAAAVTASDWTWGTGGVNGDMTAAIFRVTGADPTNPFDVAAPDRDIDNAGSTNITFPGLTTLNDNALYLGMNVRDRGLAITHTGTAVEVVDTVTANANAVIRIGCTVVRLLKTPAGVVADQTATQTAARRWVSGSIAVRSSAGLNADAGPDQASVQPGALVTLTSLSSGASTHAWSQTGGSQTAILSGANTDVCTFTAPRPSSGNLTLTFQLTAGDGVDTDTDTVSVTILGPSASLRMKTRTSGAWV